MRPSLLRLSRAIAQRQRMFSPFRRYSVSQNEGSVSRHSKLKLPSMGHKALQTDAVVLQRYLAAYNLTQTTDWYSIRAKSLRSIDGGAAVLKRWSGSASLAVMQHIPPPESTKKWLPWLFAQLPRSRFAWKNHQHQREYCDWLQDVLINRQSLSGKSDSREIWYSSTIQDVLDNHGATLAYLFQLNLHKLLAHVYPEYPWEGWRFRALPKHYWATLTMPEFAAEACRWISHVESQLKIIELADWHRVSSDQMSSAAPGFPRTRWATVLSSILSQKYPKADVLATVIKPSATESAKRASQALLAALVRELFPGLIVEEGAQLDSALTVAVVVPHRRLVFEFLHAEHVERSAALESHCRRNHLTLVWLSFDDLSSGKLQERMQVAGGS